MPWSLWLIWLGVTLQIEGLLVPFLVGARAWFAGSVSSPARARGNQLMFLSHIDASLPFFVPPSPSI